jgi:ABC-type dipeptide/oligopeptide/nickel transport system permease subunit
MLASARKLMGVKPSLLFYPSLFIFLSTVSFNMLGRLFQKENTDHA